MKLVLDASVAVAAARVNEPDGEPWSAIRSWVDAIITAAGLVLPLDRRSSEQASDLALRQRLRGADAVYVWTAAHYRLPLYTLDREMVDRGGTVCTVVVPS